MQGPQRSLRCDRRRIHGARHPCQNFEDAAEAIADDPYGEVAQQDAPCIALEDAAEAIADDPGVAQQDPYGEVAAVVGVPKELAKYGVVVAKAALVPGLDVSAQCALMAVPNKNKTKKAKSKKKKAKKSQKPAEKSQKPLSAYRIFVAEHMQANRACPGGPQARLREAAIAYQQYRKETRITPTKTHAPKQPKTTQKAKKATTTAPPREPAPQLPKDVSVGCSKCRHNAKGCVACLRRALCR